MKLIIALSVLFIFFGCKTDQDRINEAKDLVITFSKDLKAENLKSINAVYPNVGKLKRCYILNDLKMETVKINPTTKEVVVSASFNYIGDIRRDVRFILSEQENKYQIVSTRGLTTQLSYALYEFLKDIGCIYPEDDDVIIQTKCEKYQLAYDEFIWAVTKNTQRKVDILFNIESKWGFIEYDISITNNSEFFIPEGSYELQCEYSNSKNEIFFKNTNKPKQSIGAGETITTSLYGVPNGVKHINVRFVINRNYFIKEDLLSVPEYKGLTCSGLDKFSEYIKSQ